MSDDLKEMWDDSENKKHPKIINIILGVVLVIALGFACVYLWGGRDTTTDTVDEIVDTTDDEDIEEAVDENYQDFVKSIKSDIKYIMTSKVYYSDNVNEDIYSEINSLRTRFGQQDSVSVAVAYIDSDLCSSGNSRIVFEFTCYSGSEAHDMELRVAPGVKTNSEGNIDIYVVDAEVFEK